MSVIKTIKSNQYAQVHNLPLQTLSDLRSIGLLAHLMSLPEDWTIRKTLLHKRFGRRTVDHAFRELEDKGYLVSICYRKGKLNQWKYLVSDVPITAKQIEKEIKGLQIITISSIVQNEQLNMNSSKSTVHNAQLQKKDVTKEISTKEIKQINIINAQEIFYDWLNE